MITNDDLTLYNRYYDPVSKKDKYQRTYLRSIHFEKKKQINNNNGTLTNANYAEVLIPFFDGYLKPKAWRNDKTDHWTLAAKDVIVSGIVDFEISDTHPVTELIDSYDDVFTIFSAEQIGDHYEVMAK